MRLRHCHLDNRAQEDRRASTRTVTSKKHEIGAGALSTAEKSKDCDFMVATAIHPSELSCPFVDGTPYLTGTGENATNEQILHLMEQ